MECIPFLVCSGVFAEARGAVVQAGGDSVVAVVVSLLMVKGQNVSGQVESIVPSIHLRATRIRKTATRMDMLSFITITSGNPKKDREESR